MIFLDIKSGRSQVLGPVIVILRDKNKLASR